MVKGYSVDLPLPGRLTLCSYTHTVNDFTLLRLSPPKQTSFAISSVTLAFLQYSMTQQATWHCTLSSLLITSYMWGSVMLAPYSICGCTRVLQATALASKENVVTVLLRKPSPLFLENTSQYTVSIQEYDGVYIGRYWSVFCIHIRVLSCMYSQYSISV